MHSLKLGALIRKVMRTDGGHTLTHLKAKKNRVGATLEECERDAQGGIPAAGTCQQESHQDGDRQVPMGQGLEAQGSLAGPRLTSEVQLLGHGERGRTDALKASKAKRSPGDLLLWPRKGVPEKEQG